ncbi:phosphodiesterase [Novosphingobium sp. PC22D]|uniref:metallophosphoesterase n=1 Tax=Novosphingobium sp. PC22D TaxID=1962403 RepID=UPI000BF0BCB9|nr:metallophosphoesterase [Novosphingobium sp. PC22D]PEQ10664.1 phosphodiesterase [Novosphingobium sp. PC22D]
MLIAQITDIHVGFDRGNPDEHNLRRLRSVVDRLTAGPEQPDLLLLTGDLTEYGDGESYALLREVLSRCDFPVWPATGNHDVRTELLRAFPVVPSTDGFVQYALDFPGLRILVLDTLEEGRHGGAFCPVRARWLESELAAHPETPTVIVMHHPPFESGLAWLDSGEDEAWIGRFTAAVAGHEQVVAILSGHLHRTISTVWNGIALNVSASTAPLASLDLRPIDIAVPDGRPMIADEPPVFALHRWTGRHLITHTKSVTGATILAHYDEKFLPVVQLIDRERRSGAKD